MPRFVVLEHDHPVLHWDLMLEADGTLQTWRLAFPPIASSDPIEATSLPRHRLMYLDYEGPVSGDRGTVKRWDAGTFAEAADSAPTVKILTMTGTRLYGRIRLVSVTPTTWQLTCPALDSPHSTLDSLKAEPSHRQ